jgi:MFS family permease
MLEGLRYTWNEPRTRGVVIIAGTVTIFGAQFLVLLPVLARDVLGRGAEAYGWMMAAVGVGALSGALWVASYGRRFSRGRLMLFSSLLPGVLVVLLALTRQISLSLLILTALGLVLIINGAMTNTILQTLAPERLRGRVVSVYTLVAVGLAPVGALEAGFVASRFGVPVALIVGGIICLLGVLAVQLRTPEVRATTEEYPVVADESVMSVP